MKNLFFFVALFLTGCVSTELLLSDENTVVIKAEYENAAEAQVMAHQECAKHGKAASLNQFVPATGVLGSYFFDCR